MRRVEEGAIPVDKEDYIHRGASIALVWRLHYFHAYHIYHWRERE